MNAKLKLLFHTGVVKADWEWLTKSTTAFSDLSQYGLFERNKIYDARTAKAVIIAQRKHEAVKDFQQRTGSYLLDISELQWKVTEHKNGNVTIRGYIANTSDFWRKLYGRS